jgi:long-chain fatty acid transport protein
MMWIERTRGRLSGIILTLIFLLASGASGEIGPALSGMTGSANDATTAFTSPAGITRLEQTEFVVQTFMLYTESRFEVDKTNVPGGDSRDDKEIAAAPGIFYSRPLNDKWWLGASMNVPSGFGADYGKNWSGRYHAQETQLAFVAASVVAAYKVNDHLSLAVGPYLMYTDSQSKARVNNIEPGLADGYVELEEDGADVGFTIGAMVQFNEATRAGLTYRSELNPDLEGTPTFHNVGPLLRLALAAEDLLGTEVDVDFTIPQQLQLGFYHELSEQWSVTGDLIWVDMSEFGITSVQVEQDHVSVDGAFDDIWIMTTGVKYRYGEDRAVSLGGMYVTSATSKYDRSIALPLDRVIGAGVGYDMPLKSYHMHINLNYFDFGDGDLVADGGPLTGDFEGSFGKHWGVMLDFQFRKRL